MIIAFCGHSDYTQNQEDEKRILDFLAEKVGELPVEFYLGEYGSFDRFGYHCAQKFKEDHPDAKLIFVTPYVSLEYSKNQHSYHQNRFDWILYPALEKVPPRYAISHRNRWIAERADLIISYIAHAWGGAYEMYRYAKRKSKEIYNLAPGSIR